MESQAVSAYTVGKAAHIQPRRPKVRCVFRRDSGSLTFDVPPSETSAWRAVARVLRSPMDAISCVLFPSGCVLCGSSLPRLSSAPICGACWTEISGHSGPACTRCGDPLLPVTGEGASGQLLGDHDMGENALTCRACRLAPPPFERAVSFGPYEHRMRDAIHAFKYSGIHSAARHFGRLLGIAAAQIATEAPAQMLVVPVPLHRSKHAQRGFNQARVLAANAVAFLRRTYPEWDLTLAPSAILRLRATQKQAGLSPRQRRLNVRGAFQVAHPEAVAGRHILVVDDIFTTGATARAVARELRRAGAASVWVATLARARMMYKRGSKEGQPLNPSRPAAASAVNQQSASMHSSPNQPSF